MQETQVPSLGEEDAQEKEMATHASILAWKIPWTEELGGLYSTRVKRVEHSKARPHTLTDSGSKPLIQSCYLTLVQCLTFIQWLSAWSEFPFPSSPQPRGGCLAVSGCLETVLAVTAKVESANSPKSNGYKPGKLFNIL